MKFIKVFADDASYKDYRDGGNYEMPNVSLSRDSKKVYYNVDANGHECVDLGLPSGTLWATCNVGASEASDYGLYFQWGDTSGYTVSQVGGINDKKYFGSEWRDYKWYSEGSFTKYTTTGATLELEDDAAHVNMGGDWHMPTSEQIQELIANTTQKKTTLDGINGITFTSTNVPLEYIFIPAAGVANDGKVQDIGTNGCVWSSMLSSGIATAQSLGGFSMHSSFRYLGYSIRGVIG